MFLMIHGIVTYLQAQQLDTMKDKELGMSGDGQCDSPGKSAKFCTYSFMDLESGLILHTETIDKRKVALQSPNMEREGFVLSMRYLLPLVKCKEVITDASSSISHELCETNYLLVLFEAFALQPPSIQISFTLWMCGIKPRS